MSRLHRADLHPDPFLQFERWFTEACESDLEEPNAMSLATASPGGPVSVRIVLLKVWDRRGFVFFTNYGSRKSQQISETPQVGLLFYWQALHRQIRIEGQATRVSAAESLKYFATRPRGSQLGAWCSAQSSVISSRAMLDAKLQEIKQKFSDREIPLPAMWGGFRVAPERFEFWQQGEDRLHDRFQYDPSPDGSWELRRLAP